MKLKAVMASTRSSNEDEAARDEEAIDRHDSAEDSGASKQEAINTSRSTSLSPYHELVNSNLVEDSDEHRTGVTVIDPTWLDGVGME